jgi:hypothetical protein
MAGKARILSAIPRDQTAYELTVSPNEYPEILKRLRTVCLSNQQCKSSPARQPTLSDTPQPHKSLPFRSTHFANPLDLCHQCKPSKGSDFTNKSDRGSDDP